MDVVDIDGLELFGGHAGRDEVVLGGAVGFLGDVEDGLGEFFQELEDAGVGPLVLAEGFVVHEKVAEVAIAVDLVDPLGEALGGEGPLGPAAVAEAEGDVVGEAVVLQEDGEGSALAAGAADHVVGG